MTRTVARIAAAAFATGLACGAAFAQEKNVRDPNMPDPKTTVPEKVAPPLKDETTGTIKEGGNLSKQLNASDGVIHPPANVDPEMRVPAPNTGTMPVIPPPGSPGGNPRVDPK
jgi:hypothetical protein